MDKIFIIANAGINHNGDMKTAKELITIAQQAGADAISFRAFKPDSNHLFKEIPMEILKKLELKGSQIALLNNHCNLLRFFLVMNPPDIFFMDILNRIGIPIWKIYLQENGEDTFLRQAAQNKRPLLVSFPLSRVHKIEKLIEIAHDVGNRKLALLYELEENISQPRGKLWEPLKTLQAKFDVILGLSDPSSSQDLLDEALSLGVRIIEKNLTFNPKAEEPYPKKALDPEGFHRMVESIRQFERENATHLVKNNRF